MTFREQAPRSMKRTLARNCAGPHRIGTMSLKWQDADEIGYQLSEAHPGVDPLTVRFTDLHQWVTRLPEFADDPAGSNEGILEAIQMAWAEYRRP